jgi:methionyl-tRNA synthetase
MTKILITTAIDYVNDVIHIGHAYQKIVADVLARCYRITEGEEKVYFLTGTDENGAKAQEAAKDAGKQVKLFVDAIATADKREQDSLNISYDRFIRTTDKDHIETVLEFWRRVKENGTDDIYKGDFKGKYCQDCESFKTTSELENEYCLIHPKRKVETVTEKNYFFHWSRYTSFLKNQIKSNPEFVLPASRRNEVLAFVDRIEDITISRRKEAVYWGIQVPGDSTQVIYVWFDALINYLTAAKPKGFWDKKTKIVHVLGKDNLRWHALLWPAMLKSAEYQLPSTVYAHGFLTLNSQKISKSLGNIIRPSELTKKYGADPIRYYLLRYTSPEDDNDITIKKLERAYNSDLANGLGNLVARIAKLCELNKVIANGSKASKLSAKVTSDIKKYQFHEALHFIWEEIRTLDRYLEEKKPWEKSTQSRDEVWKNLVGGLRQIAFDLKPLLPETAEKIEKQFADPKIKSGKPLFPRIK